MNYVTKEELVQRIQYRLIWEYGFEYRRDMPQDHCIDTIDTYKDPRFITVGWRNKQSGEFESWFRVYVGRTTDWFLDLLWESARELAVPINA